MKNPIHTSTFRPTAKFVVFLFACMILFSFVNECYSQKGPGGIGDNDGASNLSLWLDAGKITGVADGGDVDTWEDQSGNGYNATVAPNAPTYSSTGGGNGLPTLTFLDGDEQGLKVLNNIEVMPTNEVSAIVVGRLINGGGTWDPFISTSSDDGDDDGYAIQQDDNGDRVQLWVDDYRDDVSFSPAYNLREVYTMVFNTTDNTIYGFQSEDPDTRGYGGTINYNGTGPNYDFNIGAAYDNSDYNYFLTGEIDEIIIFDVAINDAQRIIIDNYLAAKYGIALNNNDVYNEDNVGYDFDVAGIGQAADGSNHTDAQGTGLIRILNPTGLGNDEFLMWGRDSNIARGSEIADVPSGVEARFERVWRASEVDTSGTAVDVGSVNIRFDLSGLGPITASDLRLLVDTDGVFLTGSTIISSATLVSGSIYEFSGVSAISNNERFTIATANSSRTPLAISPGGVSPNLSLWLKADEGTSSSTDATALSSWADQSGNSNIASQTTGGSQPLFKDNATDNINFNPVVDFDGIDDVLSDASGILGTATYSDLNVYSVVVTDVVQNSYLFREDCSPLRISAHAPWNDGTYYWDAGSADATDRLSTAWGGSTGEPYLFSLLYSTNLGQTVSGANQVIIRNGNNIVSNMTADSFTGTNSQFNLASGNGATYHDAKYAEFVVYAGAIDATQHNKIESYLAIKYGITLPGDYTATDGTTIWSTDVAYQNDITVIGRDDAQALYQKQSHSPDDSLKVFINALAADNASNAGSIVNNVSYIVIGHNGERLLGNRWIDKPDGTFTRLQRAWKVTNTNFVDTYTIEFETEDIGSPDFSYLRLLVDDDGDFSDATIFDTSSGLTFTQGSIIVGGINTTHIPAGSTKYISIASVSSAIPLPIELIDFTATVVDGSKVELDWQTASETNNDFFTIERSVDGVSWEAIIEVEGAGNSRVPLAYSTIDKDPFHGISYYRLKQTDFDGQFEYSSARVVNNTYLESAQLKIYPNPGNSLITVEGSLSELEEIVVYNVFGQDVSASIRVTSRGNTSITMDISNLPDGLYTLKTKNNAQKIIKQ